MYKIRKVRTNPEQRYPFNWRVTGDNYYPAYISYRISINGKLIDSFLTLKAARRQVKLLSKS